MMDSPEPSCVSLKSDRSLPDPPDLSDGAVTSDLRMIRQRISSPEPSCVSLKSDRSLPDPPDLSDGAVTSDLRMIRQRISSPEPSCVSLKSDRSLPDPPDLSDGAVTSRSVRKNLFIRVYRDDQIRAQDPPQAVNDELQRVKEQHKTSMKNKYERLFEGLKLQENESLLNSIYTQLYIIEGEREGVNEEHEVLQMEKTARTQHSQDTPIYCNDIFKASAEAGCEEKEQIKTVLTKGIAGIGKTVSVQKFILDWAEGKANQDVDFMFVLPFRELNLIRDHQYSLHRLLLDFHPELQDLDSQIYEECKVVFIFDGLDESRITLMFSDAQKVCDVTETSSVAVLMSKLMKGELLPSALIWITSRPAAANQIPSKYIHRLTEIQGFTEPQKEEYFRKRISDEHQASRIISHIRRARSLHIMCHIPVFCWISSTVLQKLLEEDLSAEIPQTLTEMYIHFLLIQINMRKQKYEERDPEKLLPSNREVIVKLAEVAFKQLMKGNVMFYEEDLIESSIDVTDASVYSGICTEIFKQESVIHQRKVYSFIHLSVQEFLAAFYLLYCCLTKNQKTLHEFRSYRDDSDSDEENKKTLDEFRSYGDDSDSDEENKKTLDEFRSYGDDSDSDEENKKTLDEFRSYGDDSDSDEENKKTLDEFRSYRDDSDSDEENKKTLDEFRSYGDDSDSDEDSESDSDKVSLYDLLTSAVDKSLKSKNGRLDLFLRFLLGVSLESNQRLLQDLLTHTENSSETISRTTQYIKERIKDEDDDDDDLLMVKRGHPLSADQSINLFLCLLEVKDQTLFREIQEFVKSDKHSEKLSAAHCSTISYMLQMSEETLDELNLMKYNTPAEGRRRLIPAVIKCRKALFSGSGLSEQHCEIVSSALQSSNCVLRELDLRNNDLQDSGVKFISDGLKSPNCQLQILSLAGCNLTAQCCERLSSALQSSNCVLRELDLRNNDLQDSGVEFISDGLKSPNCQLQILSLAGCNLTAQCCERLSSALQSSNCVLRELDLRNNDLQDSGVKFISDGRKSPNCQLQILSLAGCNLTAQCCERLSSALQSSNCVLRELDLRNNDLQDSGVKFISDGLKSPNCQLQILSLAGCNLTAQCCERLSSALQSSNCVLRELDLRNNDLQDSGVKFISDGLKSPNCQLQILSLAGCNFTAQCCERLSSALQSSNCVLRELDLRNNDLQDSGVKFISDGLKSPNCQLQILSLAVCNLTAQCCERLSSALQSSNCVLRELDLRNNDLQDSGVKFISDALKSPNCQLQILSLAGCNLTAQCCERLSSALQSSNCVLRELDLRNNDLQDSGVKFISDGLKSPNCQLQILRLSGCMVTEEGCGYLSSALSSNPSHLRELDLSYNHPGESGVKLLKHKLQDPNYKLQILNVDHGGEKRMRAGPRKYACDLTLDPNTAHTQLVLSDENKKITRVRDLQPYPDHPERFDVYPQVLSVESLTGRCYWETEWSGDYTEISVSYKGINRKGEESDCVFGYNDKSWSLDCSDNSFSVCHNNNVTDISAVSSSCKRVGVYVDVSAGSLSFYSVSDTHTLTHLHTHTLTHLHTHNTTFTEPLYAGFRVNYYSSVSLCDIKEPPVRIISDAQAARSSVLRYQPLLKCQSCVHISDPDPDQWDQIEPSLCTDEGVSKFRVSTGPGRYECLRTRMRWVCDGDVTLQYHTVDGRFLNTELERLQCNRIAPVMDVTVISGKLEEVHLPHYICLGESGDALRDAVNVLSVKDEGITTEAVELTRFHAKIVQPSFSLKTLIISWILRWDEHCDLLLYRRSKDPLILHVYFFPADYRAKEKVEKNEESGYRILHPRPDRAFRMKTPHSLDVPGASVNPKEGITLRRQTDPNFFKIVIKTRLEINLQMSLTREEDKKEVWTTTLEKEEFDQNHPQRDETQRDETRLKSEADKARYFDDHWSVLIQRVTDVQIIADKLRQHQLIHEEQYSEIIQSLTSQDGMRKICAIIRKHNDTVKAKLISILQEEKLFHF
ncbi:uncharacterized protein LOC128017649 isoform X3 [Carassius gibelio]|uniref:uncharacterized protein LOC128017649 isoform X3 n=1 Tax=Carassius gibelio TaxID=101364 RepID=UPI0022778505|nr:uncharacterized protein LOC128017649 isoform X3 [Carassius gibelio]